MKTRANKWFKAIFVALVSTTVLMGCGKDNSSGGGGGGSSSGGGGTVTVNGQSVPSNWRHVLENEYQCQTYDNNGNRTNRRISIPVQLPGNVNINAGSIHVGVTLEGDQLVIRRDGNNVITELRVCDRAGIQTNNAQFIQMPVLNLSYMCSLGEISAADVYVYSNYGAYHLAFFPIGLSGPSTLCQNQSQNYWQYQ